MGYLVAAGVVVFLLILSAVSRKPGKPASQRRRRSNWDAADTACLMDDATAADRRVHSHTSTSGSTDHPGHHHTGHHSAVYHGSHDFGGHVVSHDAGGHVGGHDGGGFGGGHH